MSQTRTFVLILCFALIVAFGLGCSDGDNPNQAEIDELDRSRETLSQAMAQANSNYSYARSFSSWIGTWGTTTITVQNGQVVSRQFEGLLFAPDAPADAEPEAVKWEETGADIGTHEAGFEPKLLGELYDICEQDVLTQDPAENTIALEFDAYGLLMTCTYIPINCADDCTFGVALDWLKIAPESQ